LALHTWLLTGLGFDLTPEGNIQLSVDRRLLDGHLWQDGGDPEGIVSTISATASMLSGTLAGYLLMSGRSRRTKQVCLLLAGTLMIALGELWDARLPINKHLWTASFVLLTSGAAAILLAACMTIVDLHRERPFVSVFATFGKNPLAAFVLS